MSTLNESIVEDATLSWFGELGYTSFIARISHPENRQRQLFDVIE